MGPGDLIGDRFELLEPVGAGGMGVVYKARDRVEDRAVAVKIVPATPQTARRFAREAQVLSRLRHPAVVRYVDDGKASRGQRYLAMEWLEGEDLEARLDRGRLSVRDTVVLGRRVADALGAVHELGIIHRDLKPANIFLVGSEIAKAKVLDFGIAHVAAPIALTQSGMTLGTPAYMSPEQVQRDTRLGPRSDLFSLGCVLFECLSGRAPFVGASAVQVMQQVLREPVPDIGEVRPEAPAALAGLMHRLLAKDPAARPEDGRAVAAELAAIERDPTLAEPAPEPTNLTGDEQAFVALIVTDRPDQDAARTLVEAEAQAAAPTAAPGPSRAYGAVPTSIGHGAPALLLEQQGSARELAVRAARCALEVRDRSSGERIALVMGYARLRDVVPVGDVTRRPAEVLADAQPGELRIDSVTAGLLPSRFVVFEDATRYSLVREDAQDPPARLLAGRPTPFVGREEEARELEARLRDSLGGAPRGALVTGEAGIGKSRLVHEATRRLRESMPSVMVWTARGDPVASPPYGLVGQWLREGSGIQPTQGPEQIERALRSMVALHCSPEEVEQLVAFLGELLELSIPAGASPALDAARLDPRLMRDRVRAAVTTFLTKVSRSRPLVLWAEDLHVADHPSLELLGFLVRQPGLPLALVATAADSLSREVGDGLERAGFAWTHVGALGEPEARALIEGRLGPRAREELVARLLRRGHGNPYFLEELLRGVEAGVTDELPETVLGMIQARFDGLDPTARRVLRAGSVFGARFPRDGVVALLGDDQEPAEVEAWLSGLIDEGLLVLAPDPDDGTPHYRFRHEALRMAAYAALTVEDRRLGHLLAGRWLAKRGTTQATRLAMHFDRADAPELAREHHQRAAEEALRSFDFDAVLSHAEAAIAGGAGEAERARLRLLQAQACHLRGDRPKARVYAQNAIGVLEDMASYCRAALIIGGALFAAGRIDEGIAFARSVLRRVRDEDLADAELADLFVLGFGLTSRDGRPMAEELVRMGDAYATRGRLESPAARANLAGLKGRLAMRDGDVAAYLERTRERRALQHEARDVREVCWSDATIGYLLMELGAYAEAEHVIRAAGALAAELGLENHMALADHNLGLVLALLGRPEEGEAHERRAVERFDAQGDRRLTTGSRVYLAKILLDQGRVEEAAEEAERALDTARRQVPDLRAYAAALRAQADLARSRPEAAREILEPTLEDLDGVLETGVAEVRLTWAQILEALGRHAEAREALDEARRQLLARAAKIGHDAHRESFLRNVPENALTLELWERWSG